MLTTIAEPLQNLLNNGQSPPGAILARLRTVPLLTSYRALVARALTRLGKCTGLSTADSIEVQVRALELCLMGPGAQTALDDALRLSERTKAENVFAERASILLARAFAAQRRGAEGRTVLDAIDKSALDDTLDAWFSVALAVVELSNMRLDAAKQAFFDAYRSASTIGDSAHDLVYLAGLNLGILGGSNKGPLHELQQVLKIAKTHDAMGEQIGVLLVMGPHYKKSGQTDKSAACYIEAIDLSRRAGNYEQSRELTTILARCYLDGGDPDKARDTVLTLLDDVERRGDLVGYLKATVLMTDICLACQNYSEAIQVIGLASRSIGAKNPAAAKFLTGRLTVIRSAMGPKSYDELLTQLVNSGAFGSGRSIQ